MIKRRAHSAAYSVGQAALGANVLEQARREATAKRFVENLDGVVVGIVAARAQPHHANVALIHIFLFNQVIARFGGMKWDIGFLPGRTFGPRTELLA